MAVISSCTNFFFKPDSLLPCGAIVDEVEVTLVEQLIKGPGSDGHHLGKTGSLMVPGLIHR
jgi:hypothetical protein